METWEKETIWECFSSGEPGAVFSGHLFSRCENGVKCVRLGGGDEDHRAVVVGTAEVEEDPVLVIVVSGSLSFLHRMFCI
jgi:hypothetical protein